MTRSLRVSVGCAVLALMLLPIASTYAQSSSGPATADKEGWWNRTRGATSGTPAGGGGAPALPETVPSGAIGIAAKAGQADKVAALGIVLDAQRGSTVDRFVLTLKEAAGTGAQQNSGDAAIVACPITDFFAGAENGAFQDAPAADCSAAKSDGKRNDDGTWTFDLAAIANAWLDPFGTINPNGIRFDPTGTGTFQVSLTGVEDASFDVSISPPQEDANPFDDSTTTVPGGFTGGSSSPSGDFTVGAPPAVAAPGDATPTTVKGGGHSTATTAPKPSKAKVSRAGDVAGNLPSVLLALLVLLGGGAATLVALALGPTGRHRPSTSRRSGGVTRALEARSTTGAPT